MRKLATNDVACIDGQHRGRDGVNKHCTKHVVTRNWQPMTKYFQQKWKINNQQL